MGQFARILLLSPRLTVMVFMLIFGGIGGALSHKEPAEYKTTNAWGKQSADSSYTAQDRADDGWGSGARSGNSSAPARSGPTTQKVWVNKDGVIYEEEDIKAFDRSEYE